MSRHIRIAMVSMLIGLLSVSALGARSSQAAGQAEAGPAEETNSSRPLRLISVR
jgi:hypothetical protein